VASVLRELLPAAAMKRRSADPAAMTALRRAWEKPLPPQALQVRLTLRELA
jgi:hypothetical protein